MHPGLVCKPVSRQGLIDAASRLFCPNEDASRLVAQQLRRREAMGDTYIKPLFALLLHCRTKAVSDCRFAIYRHSRRSTRPER